MMKATKKRWSLRDWARFCRRCQRLREDISGFIRDFPDTEGLKPSHLNVMMKAHTRLITAMIRVESVMEAQHREVMPDTIRRVHGESGFMWGFCKGRVKRGTPKLVRWQWVSFGNRLKAIKSELQSLIMEFQESGAAKGDVQFFVRVERAVVSAQCGFDSLVCSQHPEWLEAIRVFYGTHAPGTGRIAYPPAP